MRGHVDVKASQKPMPVGHSRSGSAGSLRHLPQHVLAAKRIRLAQRAFGVIAPFAVHKEPVMVRTRFQFHRRPPHAVRAFLQIDGTLLPLRKIAHQLHAHRTGRVKSEGLFLVITAVF